ncbi:MAG: hypothetical protein V3U86_01875 [Acidobacteriota bacterium]
MKRVAVVLGSFEARRAGLLTGPPMLPASDRAAMALAMKRFGGRVDAYCLSDDEEARRYALAAGAESATRVNDLAEIDFDVVLVGSGGAGSWGDLLLARLAELKRCAMVFEVLDVNPGPEGMRVTRDLGRGSREILAVGAPAVLGISEDAPRLLYVSRHRRRMARVFRSGPGTGLEADPLSTVSGPWDRARPRTKTGSLSEKIGGSATGRMHTVFGISSDMSAEDMGGHVIVADAATCAQHLLRFLSHHGVIDKPVVAPAVPGSAAGPSPKQIHTRASVAADHHGAAVLERHRREPRPLKERQRGAERRPRPLQPAAQLFPQPCPGKLARGPRQAGQTGPRRIRGPYPVD